MSRTVVLLGQSFADLYLCKHLMADLKRACPLLSLTLKQPTPLQLSYTCKGIHRENPFLDLQGVQLNPLAGANMLMRPM
jgi:hypothetical protein